MKAVILAGGKGTRLKPYTSTLPKPLMPVGDKPILEIIIRQLKSQGLEDIIISVGHLGELIMSFLEYWSNFDIKIKYFKEDKPMGTVGGLSLMKEELKDTFLMINGDTLTTLSLLDLVNYHRENNAIATIALKRREINIDFGVVELDSNSVIRGYIEKPTIEHLVSMGIYIFEPKVLEHIRPNEYLDFPDLIKDLISNGETVKGFVYDGYWLDIGRAADYEKANQEIDEIYPRLVGR